MRKIKMGENSTMKKVYHPSKPHFFQPLLPDFLNNFTIPKSFVKYLGKGKEDINYEEKKAELRDKSGRSWFIKLVTYSFSEHKPRFKDGWEEFCKDHDLHVGDFLVFKHLGNLVFDVLIFAPTACERELPYLNSSSNIKIPSPNDTYFEPSSEIKSNPNNNNEIKLGEEDSSIKGGSSILKSPSYPWCRVVVQTHCFRSAMIHLPREFTEKNGLSRRWCDMELIDEKGHSWSMVLRYYRKRNNGCSYIGGWTKFHTANHLQTGDALIFQLINSGFKPIIKCIRVNDDE